MSEQAPQPNTERDNGVTENLDTPPVPSPGEPSFVEPAAGVSAPAPAPDPASSPAPAPASEASHAAGVAAPAYVATAPAVGPRRSGLFAARWFAPLATGLAGLILGLILGGVGVGLVGAMWRHGGGPGHGPLRGDDRGQHIQNNRPGPNYR